MVVFFLIYLICEFNSRRSGIILNIGFALHNGLRLIHLELFDYYCIHLLIVGIKLHVRRVVKEYLIGRYDVHLVPKVRNPKRKLKINVANVHSVHLQLMGFSKTDDEGCVVVLKVHLQNPAVRYVEALYGSQVVCVELLEGGVDFEQCGLLGVLLV